MLHVTLKGIVGHKLRFVLTALAIGLGVAFLAGTMIYTATIRRTFDDMMAETNANIDAMVRSTDTAPSPFGDLRTRIDDTLVETVRRVPGVGAAEGDVSGYAQIVARDGHSLGGFGPPTFGLSWPLDERLRTVTLVDGRGPGPGEVVVDRASFTNGQLTIGEPVKILTRQGPETFTLVGVIRMGSADSPAGATLAFFDFPTAQRLAGEPGKVDDIAVAGTGLDRAELRDRIRAALPEGRSLEVITGDQLVRETQDAVTSGLSFFSSFMLVFAVIALFVATFIINNTFAILVAQRTRELALLRALGATRAQVTGSVFVEAVVLGLVASVLGLVAGLGLALALKALMGLIGMDLPTGGLVLPPSTALVSITVGVLVTVAASVLPARRAARVAPVAGLRESAVEPSGGGRLRAAAGAALVGVGAVVVVGSLVGTPRDVLLPVALGCGAAFVGVVLLGPVLVRPVVAVLGGLARLRGEAGRLAADNARRNPRRTATTASALMIGVALVSTITVVASSTRVSVDEVIDQVMRADFVIAPAGASQGGPAGFSPQVRDAVAALPEVAVVSPVRIGSAAVAGEQVGLAAVDPPTLDAVLDLGRVEGSLGRLDSGGLAVSQRVADRRGLQVGQTVPVAYSSERVRQVPIVAVFERPDAVQDYLISVTTARAEFRDDLDFQLVVKLRPGVAPADGRRAVAAVTGRYANLQLLDQSEFKAQARANINQLLALVYALLFLSVVIALLGIANTLALSIHERIRELGLLRALGMTRRQVRTTIRYESVLVAVLGALWGLVVGIGAGAAVSLALRTQGIARVVLPGGSLVVIAVLAAVAGVLAAVSPARRAARVDMLRAIASE